MKWRKISGNYQLIRDKLIKDITTDDLAVERCLKLFFFYFVVYGNIRQHQSRLLQNHIILDILCFQFGKILYYSVTLNATVRP